MTLEIGGVREALERAGLFASISKPDGDVFQIWFYEMDTTTFDERTPTENI